jgi:high-affinity iron transporter
LELALFLFTAGVDSGVAQIVTGAFLGLLTSAVLGWMLFAGTRRLSLRGFFRVTNVLLIIFAAGLVAHGVHEFNEAGLIPPIIEHVWDMNGVISDKSALGELLKALVGYNGNPSLTEVLAYWGYFVILGWVMVKNSKVLAVRSTPA